MNFPADLLGSVISNLSAAIGDIESDPVGFLMNMLAALKLGFTNFFGGIAGYLINGLAAWLFRGLGAIGIQAPPDYSLGSILGLVFQVLGLTVEHLWTKLGEHFGPDTVAQIRGAIDTLTGVWTFIQEVQRDGVRAIWRFIADQLSGLWTTLLDMAKEWIMTRVISAVTTKLPQPARPDRDHGGRQQLRRVLQRDPVGDRVPQRHPADHRPAMPRRLPPSRRATSPRARR